MKTSVKRIAGGVWLLILSIRLIDGCGVEACMAAGESVERFVGLVDSEIGK